MKVEILTCIRNMFNFYPLEMTSVIKTCLDLNETSQTCKIILLSELAFQPNLELSIDFLEKIMMFLTDVKPSLL